MSTPGFKERIDVAIQIVTEKYPEAELYKAIGVASKGPTVDPAQIDQLNIVFKNNGKSVVIIKSTDINTFDEPMLVPHCYCEDISLQWPIKMDLNDANALKEKAGYKAPYRTVNLRNSSGQNPSFVFGTNHSEPYVFVDIITGKVCSGS
jgi:hypothetical protein